MRREPQHSAIYRRATHIYYNTGLISQRIIAVLQRWEYAVKVIRNPIHSALTEYIIGDYHNASEFSLIQDWHSMPKSQVFIGEMNSTPVIPNLPTKSHKAKVHEHLTLTGTCVISSYMR